MDAMGKLILIFHSFYYALTPSKYQSKIPSVKEGILLPTFETIFVFTRVACKIQLLHTSYAAELYNGAHPQFQSLEF